MKTIALLLILTTFRTEAQYHEILQHSKTVTMDVTLNEETVLCSKADYGSYFLKILIPDLAKHTLLNHKNLGANAPCVAAGPCFGANLPGKIIDANKSNELIDVKIDLFRGESLRQTGNDFMPDIPRKQVCGVFMIERIETNIRGHIFTHARSIDLGNRDLKDCTLDLS